MPEYIEREAVLKFIENGLNNPDRAKAFGYDAVEIMTEVQYAPAADVVAVVRCKDCGYFLEENLLCTHEGNRVFNTGKTTYPNCFCSYGERRAEDEV